MSSQETLSDMTNSTSSPESEDGPLPYEWRGGMIVCRWSQLPSHVNLLAPPVNDLALLTKDTSGQYFSSSSKSEALRESLASRLAQRMASNGSTLFKLTWKVRTTPSQRLIYALRGSKPSTSGNGFTSWPTPKVASGDYQYGKNKEKIFNLSGVVKLVHWATPMAGEIVGFDPVKRQRRREEMKEKYGNNGLSVPLAEMVTLTYWSTPRANKWGFPDAHGSDETPFSAETASGGLLNPEHPRWLQQFPIEWGCSGVMATPFTSR